MVAQFIATRPILGLCEVEERRRGDTGPTAMVGATRDRLEAGEGKGGKGGGNSGTRGSTCRGDGDTRIGNGNGGGGVTGGQWLQWGRMERGGGIRPLTRRPEIQVSNHIAPKTNKGTESRDYLIRCSGME